MIIYRDASREESTRRKVRRLTRLAEAGDVEAFFVETGELEQGVLDAWYPDRDGLDDRGQQFRAAVVAAGAAYLAARRGGSPGAALRRAARLLAALGRGPLPPRIRVQPPEGYVHYALDPALYARAAAAYRSDAGERRAERALVVGVRSIGTSLSAIVAAELGALRTVTVRPRDAGAERRIVADRALEALVARWIRKDADVLVVDEGPGATGETLAGVTAWLRAVGIPDDRIVLMPTRAWGMPLASESRKQWFAAAPKYALPLGDARPFRLAADRNLSKPEDLSAGRWRRLVHGADDEPACVLHERLKYRVRDTDGSVHLLRYAGLGRWGQETIARANALADAGIGPAVTGHADGFLLLRWTPGRPLDRSAGRDPAFRQALTDYLRDRTPRFRTESPVDTGPIVQMMLHNSVEALGPDPAGLAAAVDRLRRLPDREAVVPDGRMQPREWLRTKGGYRKVDAIDHGMGLRMPGPIDAAWDIAAAAVEFDLDRAGAAELAERCAPDLGERPADLRHTADAYRAPYAACRLGDVHLSALEAPEPDDRRRFQREASFYTRTLRRELERSAAARR